MGKTRGSITVEAVIVLPLYLLLMVFLANFLNVFYLRQTVQFGLNNAASVLSQYCYAVDKTLGMENFTLSEETSDKAAELAQAMDAFTGSAQDALSIFQSGIRLDNLGELINSGKNFASSASNLAKKMRAVSGRDLVNYLVASAAEGGGGMLIQAVVERYLDEMKVNRGLLDGEIQYALFVDGTDGRYDLVLKASYRYRDPMFSLFTDGFAIEQQAVIHPWIGGATPGLRGSLIGGN